MDFNVISPAYDYATGKSGGDGKGAIQRALEKQAAKSESEFKSKYGYGLDALERLQNPDFLAQRNLLEKRLTASGLNPAAAAAAGGRAENRARLLGMDALGQIMASLNSLKWGLKGQANSIPVAGGSPAEVFFKGALGGL